MSLPRIIFVNRVFWPGEEATAQLLHDVSRWLVANGTTPVVVTGNAVEIPDDSPVKGIEIHRVGPSATLRTGLVGKAAGYVGFLRAARARLREIVRPGDLVVAMTDPPLLGPAITSIVRSRGGRLWHWSQDLYPEVALAIRPLGFATSVLALLKPWRNRAWRQSHGVVAIGEDMRARIVSSGLPAPKVTVTPNWAPTGLTFTGAEECRKAWGVRDEFVLVYAGNLGRAHTLDPLLDLIGACSGDANVRLQIIGRGPQRPRLEAAAARRRLANCHFLDPVPRESLGAMLGAADVHLVTMRPDCAGLVWPSKFYGIVAAHRPVIFIGPREAEITTVINAAGLGLAVEPTEIERAAEFVRQLAGDPALRSAYRARVAEFARQQAGPAEAGALFLQIMRGK